MKEDLGIAMIVNPERETANEIFNLISLPSVANIERFAKGKAYMVEIVAEKGCALIGETLLSLGKKLSAKVLICAVQRGSEVIIPSGGFRIETGDRIHFTSEARALGDFLAEVNLIRSPLKNIMIVGGGRISYYLADALSKKKYAVKMIESNSEHASELAQQLPDVTVVCGNGIPHRDGSEGRVYQHPKAHQSALCAGNQVRRQDVGAEDDQRCLRLHHAVLLYFLCSDVPAGL